MHQAGFYAGSLVAPQYKRAKENSMWNAGNGVLGEDERSVTSYVTGSDPSAVELNKTKIVFDGDDKCNEMLAKVLETSIITESDVKSYMMSASELETSITGSDVKQMIEVSATKLEIPASFEILYQNDIWICDTGASSHSTPYRLGARNERASGSASLGHAGEAVKATSTIDLPGQFVAKD